MNASPVCEAAIREKFWTRSSDDLDQLAVIDFRCVGNDQVLETINGLILERQDVVFVGKEPERQAAPDTQLRIEYVFVLPNSAPVRPELKTDEDVGLDLGQ